jgi:hypothetical protein
MTISDSTSLARAGMQAPYLPFEIVHGTGSQDVITKIGDGRHDLALKATEFR